MINLARFLLYPLPKFNRLKFSEVCIFSTEHLKKINSYYFVACRRSDAKVLKLNLGKRSIREENRIDRQGWYLTFAFWHLCAGKSMEQSK